MGRNVGVPVVSGPLAPYARSIRRGWRLGSIRSRRRRTGCISSISSAVGWPARSLTPHSKNKRSPGPRRSAPSPADTDPRHVARLPRRPLIMLSGSPAKPCDTRRISTRRRRAQHNQRLDIQRNVTLSRHSALLTHPSEIRHPGPVDEQMRLSPLEIAPPSLGPLERPEPLELSASPPHQVGVDAEQETAHFLPVERAVVVHPTSDDGVHPLGQFCQIARGPQVQTPPTYCLTPVSYTHLTLPTKR